MNIRHHSRRWRMAAGALALAALACNLGSTDPETPPANTAQPKSTATRKPPTEAPEPTAAPENTDAPFTLSSEPYTHSSGAFSITLPEGWEISERDDGVSVSAPDQTALIDVSFANVGWEFDEEALATYIEAIETNWFGGFDNYSQEAYEPQQDGSILVVKALDLSDGTSHAVLSYYELRGTVVYEQDFWSPLDDYEAYSGGYLEIANSLHYDETAGGEGELYPFSYPFRGPNDLLEFHVPYGWTYSQSISDDGTTQVDIWTSPDGLSTLESIAFDDGTPVSKSTAGQFALELLKASYADDVKITGDQVQSDGSERLNWYSTSGGYDGETFFETRGTTFLLLTWTVNTDAYDLYVPVWERLLKSYTVPGEG